MFEGNALQRHMNRGLLWSLVALQKLGLIQKHVTPFNEEGERYHQRFYRVFPISVPPSLEYEMFQKSTDVSKFTGEALIEMAANTFATCIQPLAQILTIRRSAPITSSMNELKLMQRVAMSNKIALQVVLSERSKVNSKEDLKVKIDFSTHKTFYVLQITRQSQGQLS